METDQLITEGIQNAPVEIRTYLADGTWETITDDIATQNGLTEEEKRNLENEVMFILIGFDLKTNLTKNIIENVGLPSIVAGGIAIEIEQKILLPVQAFLPTEMEVEAPKENFSFLSSEKKPVIKPLQNLAQEILSNSESAQEKMVVVPPQGFVGGTQTPAPQQQTTTPPPPSPQVAPTIPAIQENVFRPTEIKSEIPIPTIPAIPVKPQQTVLEEKIAPFIGTPAEKIDWEERKIALDKNTIATGSYNGNDPYREPIG